jgi:hypothetical protein
LLAVGSAIHVFRDEIVAIGTALIGVFTAVLGVFTVSLSRSTRRAAEHIPVVERAYLFAQPCAAAGFITLDRTTVIIEVQNFGVTPAIMKEIHGEFSPHKPSGTPVYRITNENTFTVDSVFWQN